MSALQRLIALRFPGVRWIGTGPLSRRMGDDDDPVVLLDARTRREFDVSHLAGARWIDPDAAVPDVRAIPRDAPIVVYCSVGYRSAAVARRLEQAGVRDVHNLEDGIFRWANEGRPLYRGDEPVDVVHPYDRIWGWLLDARRRAEP